MEPKIKPSDLRRQAQELIQSGQMPPLEDVLGAVAEARAKYKPLIEKSREEDNGK
jgi:hypothetical protein